MNIGNAVLRASSIVFIFLTVICANVANVYCASVGWEVVAPAAFVGRKENLILGLGLTMIFILIADLFSIELLLHISDSALANLSRVLIVGYIISRIIKRPPNAFDQSTYFIAWLLATLLNAVEFHTIISSTLSPPRRRHRRHLIDPSFLPPKDVHQKIAGLVFTSFTL